MIALNTGKTLSPGDLGLNVRDANNCLFDPAFIGFSIFSVDADGTRTLVSTPKTTPARSTQGVYYISTTIPVTWEGRHECVWYLRQFENSEEAQIFEEFEVVRIDPATSSFEAPSVLLAYKPGLSKKTIRGIMLVRELLSDENPERNYHFQPPRATKVVAEFNQRVGFIWTDSTIIRMLGLNIQKLNTWNPLNLYNYTINSAPDAWLDAAAVGAAASCLGKEAARVLSDQFSYSLNGVSLDINKAGEYSGLAQSLNQEFETWAPLLTANRPFSAGLRQQRWLL